MELIIILILIAALVGMYLYFDYKFSMLRKKLMLTSNQYNKMSKNYNKIKRQASGIEVKFSTPTSKIGITTNRANVYLAPMVSSPLIKKLNIRMEVNILDKADLDSETWYYINLPVDTNLNCRGWIKENDFSILENNSKAVKQTKY